jgi:hypothetical protein
MLVAFIVVAAAILAAVVIAVRRPEPVLLDHDQPRPLDALFEPATVEDLAPVAHEGAVEGWSPAEEVRQTWILDGDPFTADLTDIDLDGAPLYAALVRVTGVDLGWMTESFTATWSRSRTDLDRLGETQPLPLIEVPA